MKTISKKAVDKITGNPLVIGRLMVLFNKSSKTIERWIEDKDVRLTIDSSIQIITQNTGLKASEILEETAAKVA
jgi:hypothetical protein